MDLGVGVCSVYKCEVEVNLSKKGMMNIIWELLDGFFVRSLVKLLRKD